ncbi:glycosyltransferase family 39 protein [bacterium]|nr:glycosyltransferase family 39 protein [bacterium]
MINSKQTTILTPERLFRLSPLLSYAVMVVLFWPNLRAFFVFDDIATLAMAAPQAGVRWIDIITPQGNGFWRPAYLVLTRIITAWFGLSPLAFHLTALVPPAVAAWLTGLVARRLFPESRWAPLIAATLMTFHIITWFAGITLANACDSLLTVALLGGVLCWERWLKTDRFGWGLGVLLFWFFAAASKETGVIFPVILTLWTWGLDRGSRRAWRILVLLWIASFIHGAAISYLQHNYTASYTTAGAFSLSPKNFGRQLTDYYDALFIPYLHVIDWPFVSFTIPNWFYWILRFITAGALCAFALVFLTSRRPRRIVMLLVIAIVPLVLPSLMTGKPAGRFLYPALPFAVLAVVGILIRWRPARTVLILWVFFALSFYVSYDINTRRIVAEAMGRFTTALEAEAKNWPPRSTVAFLYHPHPGDPLWRGIYVQLHANVFIPWAHAKIVLRVTPDTKFVYQFRDPRLVRLPLK